MRLYLQLMTGDPYVLLPVANVITDAENMHRYYHDTSWAMLTKLQTALTS